MPLSPNHPRRQGTSQPKPNNPKPPPAWSGFGEKPKPNKTDQPHSRDPPTPVKIPRRLPEAPRPTHVPKRNDAPPHGPPGQNQATRPPRCKRHRPRPTCRREKTHQHMDQAPQTCTPRGHTAGNSNGNGRGPRRPCWWCRSRRIASAPRLSLAR